jgi:hypothetical protein
MKRREMPLLARPSALTRARCQLSKTSSVVTINTGLYITQDNLTSAYLANASKSECETA